MPRKKVAKSYVVEKPKQMFHMGEIDYIKKRSARFMLMLSDVGGEDGAHDWVEEASNLMDEFVLQVGKEMGLNCYEEIMRVMLMFIESHNVGKQVGFGYERKEYERWIQHGKDLDYNSRSDFERDHPHLWRIACFIDNVSNFFNPLKRFFGYA